MESSLLTYTFGALVLLPLLAYVLARMAALGYYRGRQAYYERRRRLNGERRHEHRLPERRVR